MGTKLKSFNKGKGGRAILFLAVILLLVGALQAVMQADQGSRQDYPYEYSFTLEDIFIENYGETQNFQNNLDLSFFHMDLLLRDPALGPEDFFSNADGGIHFSYYGQLGSYSVGDITEEQVQQLIGGYSNEMDGQLYVYENGSYHAYGADTVTPEAFLDSSGTIYIYFPQDSLDSLQISWARWRTNMLSAFTAACILLPLALACLVWLTLGTGRDTVGNLRPAPADRMWGEAALGIFLLSVLGIGILLSIHISPYGYAALIARIAGGVAVALLLSLALAMYLLLVRQLKCRTLTKNSLCAKIITGFLKYSRRLLKIGVRYVRQFYRGARFDDYKLRRVTLLRHFTLFAAGLPLVGLSFVALDGARYGNFFAGIVLLLLMASTVAVFLWHTLYLIRSANDTEDICGQIKVIAGGDLTYRSQVSETSPIYRAGQDLDNIGAGLQKSLAAQIRGERMKIDLVTNVSHDLKTPLTSIISYLELLSKEELSAEASDYVNILNQKSQNLNHMVSDLFDLAKTTSGNLQVDMERLDLSKLLVQTLSDMDDDVRRSGRIIRKTILDPPVPILGDGKKLYRVFQNVIGNALKYSLEGTRIFIQMALQDGRAVITVINTASYEMDFSEEEILERFARGDKSRASEGAGLGLSIARGFVTVCGGTFSIEIAGDQFKCTVTFPIAPE